MTIQPIWLLQNYHLKLSQVVGVPQIKSSSRQPWLSIATTMVTAGDPKNDLGNPKKPP